MKKADFLTWLARAKSRKQRSGFLTAVPRRKKMRIFNTCVHPTKSKKDHRSKGHIRTGETTIRNGFPVNKLLDEIFVSETRVADIAMKFSSLKLDWRSRLGKRSVGCSLDWYN